eukprot:1161182-Pelagomonas_calceolata.AAC.8
MTDGMRTLAHVHACIPVKSALCYQEARSIPPRRVHWGSASCLPDKACIVWPYSSVHCGAQNLASKLMSTHAKSIDTFGLCACTRSCKQAQERFKQARSRNTCGLHACVVLQAPRQPRPGSLPPPCPEPCLGPAPAAPQPRQLPAWCSAQLLLRVCACLHNLCAGPCLGLPVLCVQCQQEQRWWPVGGWQALFALAWAAWP